MQVVSSGVARRPRAYVRVAGPDAEDYLQRMLSNDVSAGDVCDALNTGADLKVTMSVSPLTARHPGDSVEHTVRVTNLGPQDAAGVRVDVSFTAGFSLTQASPAPGTTYSGTTWDVGPLKVGEARATSCC